MNSVPAAKAEFFCRTTMDEDFRSPMRLPAATMCYNQREFIDNSGTSNYLTSNSVSRKRDAPNTYGTTSPIPSDPYFRSCRA